MKKIIIITLLILPLIFFSCKKDENKTILNVYVTDSLGRTNPAISQGYTVNVYTDTNVVPTPSFQISQTGITDNNGLVTFNLDIPSTTFFNATATKGTYRGAGFISVEPKQINKITLRCK